MQIEEHSWKTLGPKSALLVTLLHERNQQIFTYQNVTELLGLSQDLARSFMAKLVNRGLVTRLKPGLFILVPFELGREGEYLGNPYRVARELAGEGPYYLSHASALSIHQMITQPQLIVYTSTPRMIRGRTILGTEFRFVQIKPEHLFGIEEYWVDKHEKVFVSNLERTIIDGLRLPEYGGGISEVAKAMMMRQKDLSAARLVEYAEKLGVGAVLQRLGFLMELHKFSPVEVERLQKQVGSSYTLMDPTLPREGKFLARWKLRLNVTPEEFEAVGRT
jgi:predicted transcriptional regulator of viral defense system